MEGFNKFIDNNLWLDLPAVEIKFIWYRFNEMTKSILDRALVSDNWLLSGSRQYVLNMQVLDHCALVLKLR